MTMIQLYLLILLLITQVLVIQGGKYPQASLQCYSYLTKPDLRLICPEARAKFCVKEVTSLTQNLCGSTEYYGDLYINRLCQFKKCSDVCEEGATTFTHNGQTYSRETYCCNTNLCNSAWRSMKLSNIIMLGMFSVVAYLLI